ncbi:MAG: hydroxymethylglutaryl-CoA lyase [Bdellovibrionales bacterium]
MKVEIIEVGPRDGLQNENQIFSVAERAELVRRLSMSGLKRIETGAFVSEKWVPQMNDSGKLYKKLQKMESSSKLPSRNQWIQLVPNVRGYKDSQLSGVKNIAVFGACSDSFSKKNINRSMQESFKSFSDVSELAKRDKVKIRGYLSTVFGCPYEGKVKESVVLKNAEKLLKLGVYEISFGDTIGVANPKQVKRITQKLLELMPKDQIAMHFHDTRAMAMANIATCLELDVLKFDASIGGLGGCPYAKGASGNVATEDVVNMLHEMGYKTGLDLKKLVQTARWLEKKMSRTLPSKLTKINI